jgi:MYXO-CTERM domain-containing protein
MQVLYGDNDLQALPELIVGGKSIPELEVALVPVSVVTPDSAGPRLQVTTIAHSSGLCADEPMAPWPAAAFCSGVRVAPGLVATARHCLDQHPCEGLRIVSGFRFPESGVAAEEQTLPVRSIFECRDVILPETTSRLDLALLRVEGAGMEVFFEPRSALTIAEPVPAMVVGHPLGAPATLDASATVEANPLRPGELRAKADTFAGHSGSAVIDHDGRLLGLLVGGAPDLTVDEAGNCARPRTWQGDARERVQPLELLEIALCGAAAPHDVCARPEWRTRAQASSDGGSSCAEAECPPSETPPPSAAGTPQRDAAGCQTSTGGGDARAVALAGILLLLRRRAYFRHEKGRASF